MWDNEDLRGFHLRIALFYHDPGGISKGLEIPEKRIPETLQKALAATEGDVKKALAYLETRMREEIRRR